MDIKELLDLLISWIVISFCFSFSFNILNLMYMLPISLLTVGFGFIVHELSHRYVAKKYGCIAYYKLWKWGIIFALLTAIISGGKLVFAAPGAVNIVYPVYWYGIDNTIKRLNGLVALSGPAANIILAIFFYVISLLGESLFGIVGYIGFKVNIWLALFNLIPLHPLDGWKVYMYNAKLWFIIIIFTLCMYILS